MNKVHLFSDKSNEEIKEHFRIVTSLLSACSFWEAFLPASNLGVTWCTSRPWVSLVGVFVPFRAKLLHFSPKTEFKQLLWAKIRDPFHFGQLLVPLSVRRQKSRGIQNAWETAFHSVGPNGELLKIYQWQRENGSRRSIPICKKYGTFNAKGFPVVFTFCDSSSVLGPS